ncbi:MAG TPA: hypothetical protein ENN28_02955 [Candidatus Uhrbacteria bacterium]|nr:hypothetical protein [Candidatus Uhrbacteria bacterium]
MFLTVHGTIGILIGQKITSPWLAFILGFVFHYIFDMIPHGDTKAPKKYYNIVYACLAGIFDLLLLAFLIIFISSQTDIFKISVLFAISGSLLPDILQALYFISREKMFKFSKKTHDYFHNLISQNFELSFAAGLIFQLIIVIILTKIII